jgi:nitronate monooxygenase
MTLCELLAIDLPFIQAPMAGFQGADMASAVSNAGALGSLPCATLSAAAMCGELASVRGKTSRPFNVNFFCHANPTENPQREAAWRLLLSPYLKEYGIVLPETPAAALRRPFNTEAADALESFRPAVVSFHFGLPSPSLLARVKSWGSKVLSSATTVEEARWLEAQGADAIIAQGAEAGGHRAMFLSDDLTTQLGTFALLPQMLNAVTLPVIASGGIADAKGVAAAMSMGAAGVQVGTAFLLCPEATTSSAHRAALKAGASVHTALTNLFSGRPARGIMNRLMRELGPINSTVPEFPLASSALAPLRAKAESEGVGDFSPLWSGQNASGCREIPAAIMMRTLTERIGSGDAWH